MHSADAFLIAFFALDRHSNTPLYRQVYDQLRDAILTDTIPAECKVPSSRELATALKVSRNTIMNAVDQLVVEGYLENRARTGVYVSKILPDSLVNIGEPIIASDTNCLMSMRTLSGRGQYFAEVSSNVGNVARTKCKQFFSHGTPDIEGFPTDIWSRLLAKHSQKSLDGRMYNSPESLSGHPTLKTTLASHLRISRGVKCEPEQILIVSGSQQGLYLSGQLLLDQGDSIWMEDPGYLMARMAFSVAGAKIIPIQVEKDGLNVQKGIDLAPDAKCVFTTPSHQFPLGYTMSIEKRLRLLEWAAKSGSWIIEDDHDSEFRYGSQPIPSLQGLDTEHRVIYLGTFSKVMFPSLRLGYMVLPHDLVNTFQDARTAIDIQSPTVVEAALAEFIAEGHFSRHIRRMRRIYAGRRATLVSECARVFGDRLTISKSESGMHVVAYLPYGCNDVVVKELAAEYNLDVAALSHYHMNTGPQPGIILGFANIPSEECAAGVELLHQAIGAHLEKA